MRELLAVLGVIALALASSACATKTYVSQRIGEVNDRVTAVSDVLQRTDEQARKNQARIGEVDATATSAQQRAEAADQSAGEARKAADAVNVRVDKIDAASRRLVYEVVLSEDKAKFGFGKAVLSDEARAEIDGLVKQLRAEPRNVWIEIEGHTDATGPREFNHALGLERAGAVMRYLHEQHHVPLHKMNVVSYGESQPLAPNNTREGRTANRRVTVKVLG